MIERPILFSAEMVRAVLRGDKTQTRRVVKPSKKSEWLFSADWADSFVIAPGNNALEYCPYGQVGDQLWVRETFCQVDDTDHGGELWVDYRATPKYSEEHPAGWENAPCDHEALKWKPSIFMPRALSRIQLDVLSVRVERLRDISVQDIVDEGINAEVRVLDHDVAEGTVAQVLKHRFMELWDGINAKRGYGWDTNPWVWAVEFGVIE